MEAETNLILVRGVSGAGKSTIGELFANHSQCKILSTDDLFYVDGEYVFDPSKLGEYHKEIIDKVEVLMDDYARMIKDTDYSWLPVDTIVVCNTFTELWEMEPYLDLAKKYDWRVHTKIVENRHKSESIHNVPPMTVQAQRTRFEVRL